MSNKTTDKTETPPWDKPDPKPKSKQHTLTKSEKEEAKKSAEEHGRPYPNLVDNMKVAKKAKSKD